MTRLKIMSMLQAAAMYKSEDDGVVWGLCVQDLGDRADELIEHDLHRTATAKAVAVLTNPLYTPPTNSGELPPLVVEEASANGWFVSTPDKKWRFNGTWEPWASIPPDDLRRTHGPFASEGSAQQAAGSTANIERPDRVATVARPAVKAETPKHACLHRFVSFLDVGDCIERRCNDCGNVVRETPKPTVRWRAASERPEKLYRTIVMKLGGKSSSYGWESGVPGECVCLGCHNGDGFRPTPNTVAPDTDVLGWLYASEVLPE